MEFDDHIFFQCLKSICNMSLTGSSRDDMSTVSNLSSVDIASTEMISGTTMQLTTTQQNERRSPPNEERGVGMNNSRAHNWFFTLNNYTEEDLVRLRALENRPTVSYLLFGFERSSTGTPHLQGFVSFSRRLRFAQVINEIGQCHIEVARNVTASIEYCKKEGSFEEFGEPPKNKSRRSDLERFKDDVKAGNYSHHHLRENHSAVWAKYSRFCYEYVAYHKGPKKVECHRLRIWQTRLVEILRSPPDDRKVIFLVDERGNSGKSWFAHYWKMLHPKTCQVLLPGKKSDMCMVIQEFDNETTPCVIFIDAPRSKQGEYLQYDFLEELKNGYLFSPKYDSRNKTFGPLHVVVSMNELPDYTKLSSDRYKTVVITPENNVPSP